MHTEAVLRAVYIKRFDHFKRRSSLSVRFVKSPELIIAAKNEVHARFCEPYINESIQTHTIVIFNNGIT